MRRTLLPIVLALVVVASLAAACGSDGDTTAEASPTTAGESPAATESAEPAAETTPSTTETPEGTSPAPLPPTSEAPAGDDPPILGGEAGDANAEEFQRFVTETDDGPFYMVNLIRYRDRAEYPDGRESDLTGEEADNIYGQYMFETKLPEIGAEVVYIGDVERDMIGDSAFDRVGVVRYPSRAAFVAMTQDPQFQEMSIHKEAGVADTVVMATTLLETPDAPVLDDPPFPATDSDPAFAFVHVLDYHDTAQYADGDVDADPTRSGEEAVSVYSANAGTVALPLGVRVAAWFDVEATIIGPVGTWEEVRINTFPSHATFQELVSDPTWQSGQHHRDAGLAETYAIMTLPRVNTFNGVVADS